MGQPGPPLQQARDFNWKKISAHVWNKNVKMSQKIDCLSVLWNSREGWVEMDFTGMWLFNMENAFIDSR